MIFGNTKTFFSKKILLKSKYLLRIVSFLISSKVMWAFLAKYINIELKLKKVIYITKILTFLFNITLANFFF